MIYLFAGDDTEKKIKVYEKFLKDFGEDLDVFIFNKNNFHFLQAESFFSGAGLFFKKCIIVFSDVLEKEEIKDFVFDKLPFMASSHNLFIFREGKLKKTDLDIFKKNRAELNVFELPKEKKEAFNNFLLADAFSDRNKLYLWVYFRQAIGRGVSLEEVTGVLFWKVKDMILKNNFSKFKKEELQNIAFYLSFVLPKARREGRDDESAFEQFLLEVF